MSADNWGVCPKCVAQHIAKRSGLSKRLEEDYGKIPLAEYKGLEYEYDQMQEHYSSYSLREDYELYLESDGGFYVDYCASCACGFKFSFRHSEDVEIT